MDITSVNNNYNSFTLPDLPNNTGRMGNIKGGKMTTGYNSNTLNPMEEPTNFDNFKADMDQIIRNAYKAGAEKIFTLAYAGVKEIDEPKNCLEL